ncbi:hypothetical protein GCM10011514_06520 [Emticicia aquatilis]|uniref:Uncharacterized protein n=1 Tax=Emticicia aquatilis TaxID=1537369 RepID=A0A916YHG4_9BACT|nr:hypothetical protein [Emticicia aquatilis]GGD45166.1 hypothetical protein GCM10011514_06520 [Emticicia aquatilis]
MKQIGHNVFVHQYSPTAGVVVSFGKDGSEAIDGAVYSESGGNPKVSSSEYIKRGENDAKLLEMHRLATESPNKWALLSTKASFIGGWGFRLFDRQIHNMKEQLIPFYSTNFDEFHDRLDLDDFHQAASYQLAFGNELNVKMTLDSTNKVASLEVVDNNDIRSEKPLKGKTKTERFWLSNKFGFQKTVKKEDCLILPAYDASDPTKYPVCIIHQIKRIPMQRFNGMAEWWGSKEWGEVTNDVPKYYKAAFRNGFFVTHHISIPDDYFDKEGLDDVAKEKLKIDTLNEIADVLSGIDDANKILVTFSKYSADGKGILKEIKVTPITNPIKDEAFIRMFEAANLVQASSHAMPGKLAGVQLGSQMGSSGKEIVAEADYLQDYLTYFDRTMICKPVQIAKRIEGLEPLKVLGIKRMESYTPDVTPKDNTSNPNPK